MATGRTQSSRHAVLQVLRIVQAVATGRTQSSRHAVLQVLRIVQAVATAVKLAQLSKACSRISETNV